MNIVDNKHHAQHKSHDDKNDFKMISNVVTMIKKADNFHPAKIISINQGKYLLTYKKLQQRFTSGEYSVFKLNEFRQNEPPVDHVMFLKNFCS